MTGTTNMPPVGTSRVDATAMPAGPPLDPQSTGEDGRQRLERAWATPERFAWLKEVNNTTIGILYVATGFLFFLGAGVLALLMRIQLAYPGLRFLDPGTYNQFFTMHGTVMMFLFAVPIVEAFAVMILPAMLGTRDMPFPWLSAFGYWCYAIGGALVFSSLFFGVAPDGGWFMYPPLTSSTWSPGINTDVWVLGLGFVEIAAIAAAVELIVGILKTRAPGMTLARMPVFAWYMLVTAGMIMLGMPAVIAADILLELERALGMPFYDPRKGGDPLLWQHLFWLFGHPEVYIIFLPAAGMISMMLPALVQARLVGYLWIVLAAIAVGFLSFGLWVHHMFATGLPRMSLAFFSTASSIIAIPMGIQVFAWLATIWDGRPRLTVPMLWILGAIFIFVIGGLTGVMVAAVTYDWVVHDTYFVVAHLHYVLIGGMVFPILAGLYYWMPLVSGRMMSERLGKWGFGLSFIGFNGAFLPMHVTGLRGMPRRVYTYVDGLGWNELNLVSTVFAFVLAAGILVIVADLALHFRRGGKAGDNPWAAPSLEWISASRQYGFRSIPVIAERYPAWDRPGLAADIEAGRGYLPDTPTGRRQSLLTSPLDGTPEQILTLPGPSWIPFLGALFIALALAAATIKLMLPAVALGVVGAGLLAAWLWRLDAGAPREPSDAGLGLALPTYGNGSASVGAWGLGVTLVSDAAVTASFVFSYLFLWTARPALWPPLGGPLPMLVEPAIAGLAAVAAWLLFRRAERIVRDSGGHVHGPPRHRRFGWRARAALMLAAAGTAAAVGAVVAVRWILGIAPDHTATAYFAAVWVVVGWTVMHLGIGLVMSLWCLARLGLGLIDDWRCLTLRVCTIFWGFTAVATLLTLTVVAGFPHAHR